MCEWNVKLGPDGKVAPRTDDSMFAVVVDTARRVVWHLTPWRHGPDCKWIRWARTN